MKLIHEDIKIHLKYHIKSKGNVVEIYFYSIPIFMDKISSIAINKQTFHRHNLNI